MKKEITDKVFVVMLKGGYKCYLNERQKDVIGEGIILKKTFVKVDNFLFKTEDISFVLPASEIEREDKVKKGDYKCDYGFWHTKNEACGHGEIEKYNRK